MPYWAEWILLFTIYSLLGWICESTYCSILAKKFVNRGFLNGPFCPIYGVGALLIVKLLSPFSDNLVILFFASLLLTSLLEYLTGFAMEKLFHAKWWDYSHRRFNIQGRVCLGNALIFGVMGVVVMRLVHPFVMRLVQMIPSFLAPFLAAGLAVYFVGDTVVTIRTILDLNKKVAELQKVLDEIREKSRAVLEEKKRSVEQAIESRLEADGKPYAEYLEKLRQKQAALERNSKLLHRRLMKAFPTMKSLRANESLARLREALEKRRNGRKAKKQ